jgi:hypothetical protein
MNSVAVYPKQVARGGTPMRARMRAALTAVALVFVALTSLAAPGAADAAAGGLVPFKGTLEGVETASINPGPPPTATIQGVGTGHATHLGRFTYDNPHTVDLLALHGCGTWTFTAANGDTLTASGCGDATVVSGTPPTAVLSIVETGEITGGTGRFAGATGSFTVTRLLATGETTGSFTGTISSPGANH